MYRHRSEQANLYAFEICFGFPCQVRCQMRNAEVLGVEVNFSSHVCWVNCVHSVLSQCSFARAQSHLLSTVYIWISWTINSVDVFAKVPLSRVKFTLQKYRGELVWYIVRRHVTVQLGFACNVHSYIGACKFGLILVLVFNGLCSLPNQQRFLKHL